MANEALIAKFKQILGGHADDQGNARLWEKLQSIPEIPKELTDPVFDVEVYYGAGIRKNMRAVKVLVKFKNKVKQWANENNVDLGSGF